MKDLSGILGLKSEPVASGVDGPAAYAPHPVVRDPPQRANLSKLRRLSLGVVFGLTACATAAVPGSVPIVSSPAPLLSPYERALAFSLEAPPETALQRRLDLPDASVLVLQGFAFVLILAAEAWRGRLAPWLTARAQQAAQADPTHETSRQRLQREALAALRKRKEAA